ncbi:hypothetical protein H6F89_20975 [Cyanobacteria bacterium FACHB-63]|nr:hypothetical protein [Cyanobacteria bacterium FACHB-63]
MDNTLILLALGTLLVIGIELVASGKPFTMKATGTPIGSFEFHGNIANIEPPLLLEQEPHDQSSEID